MEMGVSEAIDSMGEIPYYVLSTVFYGAPIVGALVGVCVLLFGGKSVSQGKSEAPNQDRDCGVMRADNV